MGCPSPRTLSPFLRHGARETYFLVTDNHALSPSPREERAGRGYGERGSPPCSERRFAGRFSWLFHPKNYRGHHDIGEGQWHEAFPAQVHQLIVTKTRQHPADPDKEQHQGEHFAEEN